VILCGLGFAPEGAFLAAELGDADLADALTPLELVGLFVPLIEQFNRSVVVLVFFGTAEGVDVLGELGSVFGLGFVGVLGIVYGALEGVDGMDVFLALQELVLKFLIADGVAETLGHTILALVHGVLGGQVLHVG